MARTAIRPGWRVLPCAGVPIAACSPDEAASEVIRLASGALDRGVDVHLCNAYTLALADRSPEYRSMLNEAGLNLPDGKSVVWANRLVHGKAAAPRERVAGPDLFRKVFALSETAGTRHYLIGGTPEVLEQLIAELGRRYPAANIVGAESPPFRVLTPREREEQVTRLVSSGAQLVWLGLGTPKQDWEAAHLARIVPAAFCAVGAAFDFVAGTKRQAPGWMQDHGLEWLYRLSTEPRRLWRRYLFGNIRFLTAMWRRR